MRQSLKIYYFTPKIHIAYVLGLEPCNCKTLGRAKERKDGSLRFIYPGETKHINLDVEILESRDAIIDNLKLYE